jgi:hypothetical protein
MNTARPLSFLKESLINPDKTESSEGTFNPYHNPPDLNLANLHGKARRVCYPTNEFSKTNNKRCPCCGLLIENKQIGICASTNTVAHLGICFPLYFDYIKFAFLVLIICFVGAGFNIYINYEYGNNCQMIQETSIICQISFLNLLGAQEKGFLQTQSTINNILTVVILIIFEVFRRYMKRLEIQYDTEDSVTEFALLVSGVPASFKKHDLQEFIDNRAQIIGCEASEIKQVLYLEQLGNFAALYREKMQLLIDVAKDPKNKIDLDERLKEFNRLLGETENNYGEKSIKNSRQRLILILENSLTCNAICKYYKKNLLNRILEFFHSLFKIASYKKKFFFRGYNIKIQKAPEPSDLVWENILVSSSEKNRRKLITTLVVVVLLIGGFAILLMIKKFLKSIQFDYQDSDTGEYVSVAASLAAATAVALMNTTLGIFIRKFARYESHKTQTNYFVITGKRLSAVLFINMTFTTMLANVIHSAPAPNNKAFWNVSTTGLFYDLFFLFITNSYMSSIFNFFDIMWGVKLLKRRKVIKDGNKSKMTQIEANILFEGHPVDLALRWANVNKTLIYTGTFIPFIPIGIFFSFIGFFICYWVDKYLLLRRYTAVHRMNHDLSRAMFSVGEFFLVALTFGNLLIYFIPSQGGPNLTPISLPKLANPYFWWSLLLFCLAIAYNWFLPMDRWNGIMFNIAKKEKGGLYSDKCNLLSETYDYFNPLKKRYSVIDLDFSQQINHEMVKSSSIFRVVEYNLSVHVATG